MRRRRRSIRIGVDDSEWAELPDAGADDVCDRAPAVDDPSASKSCRGRRPDRGTGTHASLYALGGRITTCTRGSMGSKRICSWRLRRRRRRGRRLDVERGWPAVEALWLPMTLLLFRIPPPPSPSPVGADAAYASDSIGPAHFGWVLRI